MAKSLQNDENKKNSVINTVEKSHCVPTKSDAKWRETTPYCKKVLITTNL